MGVIPESIVASLDVAQQYVHGLAPGDQKDFFFDVLRDLRHGVVESPLRSLKSVQPSEFTSSQDYFTFAQFRALVSKIPYSNSDADREASAKKAFSNSERKCARTNRRLRHFLSHRDRMSDDVRVCLSRARAFVHNHLGLLTDGKYERILDLARPGPGLTIGTWNRFRTSPVYKYTASDPTCSESARSVAVDFFKRNLGIARLYGEWTSGLKFRVPIESADNNRISFVPKDGLTLRSIAIEPNINMQLQLGVHEYMIDVLGRIGDCDIRDQRRNQLFSKLGSTSTLGFATLDLSSASDSLSIELVRYLLPSCWFSLLDALRSHSYSLEGSVKEFEKFSSMGNGFTFALETLVFRALVEGVVSLCDTHGVVAVYGDDLIVPQGAYALLTEVLKFCGFSLNQEKSYCFGPFRESCGTDWYRGDLVTPLYLRKERLGVRDVNRIINEWKHSLTRGKVVSYLIRKLGRNDCLFYGLTNEDPGSCVFVHWLDARERGLLKYSKRFQAYRFKGLQEIGVPDRSALPHWKYLNSLYGGLHDLTLRSRTEVRVRWLSPGRKIRLWYDPI